MNLRLYVEDAAMHLIVTYVRTYLQLSYSTQDLRAQPPATATVLAVSFIGSAVRHGHAIQIAENEQESVLAIPFFQTLCTRPWERHNVDAHSWRQRTRVSMSLYANMQLLRLS
jgi:hypothetical protein